MYSHVAAFSCKLMPCLGMQVSVRPSRIFCCVFFVLKKGDIFMRKVIATAILLVFVQQPLYAQTNNSGVSHSPPPEPTILAAAPTDYFVMANYSGVVTGMFRHTATQQQTGPGFLKLVDGESATGITLCIRSNSPRTAQVSISGGDDVDVGIGAGRCMNLKYKTIHIRPHDQTGVVTGYFYIH